MRSQVVEVRSTAGHGRWPDGHPTHRARRFLCGQAAGVAAGLRLGVGVVVAAKDNQRGRVCFADGLCDVPHVAGVECDRHGQARRLMNGERGGRAFADQQHRCAGRVAAPVHQPCLAASRKEVLLRLAISGLDRCDALHVLQLAGLDAHRHQQRAVRQVTHTVPADTLALQVGT